MRRVRDMNRRRREDQAPINLRPRPPPRRRRRRPARPAVPRGARGVPAAPPAGPVGIAVGRPPVVPLAPVHHVVAAALPQQIVNRYAKRSTLNLIDKMKLQNIPANQFPYKTGEYVIDHNNHGEKFEGFVRAASEADPLASTKIGNKYRIGNHVEIHHHKQRFQIVVHKGIPPRAMKLLVGKLTDHVKSLPKAHVELFQKKGVEFIKVVSAAKLRRISPRELARILLRVLGKKRPYVVFVMMQTHMGGSMSMPHTHTQSAHRNLLRRM